MSRDKASTNIGNLDQKIEMLEAQFDQCIQNFHDPITFMSLVDSMIQNLRNYTFTIQANKMSITNFDNWYGPWQERMKEDEYMTWLAKTRTGVVHEDILTTASNAVLTFNTDHAETHITKYFDIKTSTEKIIEGAKKLAQKNPALKHSTGKIQRHYIFEVNKEKVEALNLLSACFAFMRILHIDLSRFLKDEEIITGKIPPIKDSFLFPLDKLGIIFKLKDGSVLSEEIISATREEMLKGRKEAKERYGNFRPKNKMNGKNKLETMRAHFELARRIFETDGHHITMMHVHDKDGWHIITPIFRDRAEKILFWRNFSATIKEKKIDEIIFTTESWTYPDVEKGIKHIQAGKEIKTLRKKGEILQVDYLNKSGKIITASAPIIRTKDKVILGKVEEKETKPEDYPIFYPVFVEWGLLDKLRINIAPKKDKKPQ